MIIVTVHPTYNYNRYLIEALDDETNDVLETIDATRDKVTDRRNQFVERLAEEHGAVEAAPVPELWEMPLPHEERGGGFQ